MRRVTLPLAEVIERYTIQHETMQEIADLTHISRAAISRRLKRAGITSEQGERVNCLCPVCGQSFSSTRKRWKQARKRFCSMPCYTAQMQQTNYHAWRHGQRLARTAVKGCFPLQEGQIVHHVDGDNRNNKLENLWVFTSNADHMSFHRGGLAQPIWKGYEEIAKR